MQIIRDFFDVHLLCLKTIAVGVSGGADSLALVLMLKEECPNYRIIALTVDHQLRPTSYDEALYVAKLMRQYGIEHHILTWEAQKPQTGIEEQARAARYKLLCEWCLANDVSYLAIAHHLYDQAETFLMRLERGSGLYGLSAMGEIFERDGIKILRPFLNIHPQILKDYLKSKHICWVEDESNQCMDFLRVKLRQFLPILQENTGISPERICEAAADLRRVKQYMEDTLNDIINCYVHIWGDCGYSFDYSLFLTWHKEIRFYLLQKLITSLNKCTYAPEAFALQNLSLQLLNIDFSGATLGGCHIIKENLKIWIIKEYRENTHSYTTSQWESYVIENPEVRGLKIPYKLRLALMSEKISKKM